MLVLDVALPFLTYRYLRQRWPGMPLGQALAWTIVFPAAANVLSLLRRRRLDIIGIFVLTGIAVSIAAVGLGGDPRLILIRESFVTGAMGLLCFISLIFPRPLMFYVGRQFTTGDDPARVAEFNALWQFEGARRTFRLITIVWGVGWLGEALLRTVMAFTLPVAQVLAIAPLVLGTITVAMILWTLQFAARRRTEGEATRRSAAKDSP